MQTWRRNEFLRVYARYINDIGHSKGLLCLNVSSGGSYSKVLGNDSVLVPNSISYIFVAGKAW